MSEENIQPEKTTCNRCGNCCKQGGPALHGDDHSLFTEGRLALADLVTVRRGELALQPLEEKPRPVREEFLKLKGQGGTWCCRFYDHDLPGCSIYGHRPLACGLLNCTSPEALLAVAGRDLLTRFDLISADDPLLGLVHEHEKLCSCPDLSGLEEQLRRDGKACLTELTRLVNLDMRVRFQANLLSDLSLDLELFYFGRPLFQLLQPLGMRVTESGHGLVLHLS